MSYLHRLICLLRGHEWIDLRTIYGANLCSRCCAWSDGWEWLFAPPERRGET